MSMSCLFFHTIRETDTSESEGSSTVQSTAIFGAVGGALGAVVSVAVVLIVVVTAVMIVTKKRKPNHPDATQQGTSHVCISTDSSHCMNNVRHDIDDNSNSNVYRHVCNLRYLVSLSK